MAKFKERTTAPKADDKRWIHYSKGGYNTACIIEGDSVLANCVGYACGRYLEIKNAKKADWSWPVCNAEDCFEQAQKNGFQTGNEPKLGAAIVWKQGQTKKSSDGYGHIATVEMIYSNGDILISQSCYGGARFETKKITKSSNYQYAGTFEFLGFIYCGIEFDQEPDQPEPEDYSKNTTPNRFKVVVDGKQIGAYTSWDNAKKAADASGGIVTDGTNGPQIYPDKKNGTKNVASREKEDYTKNTTPNRFKVKKYDVQLAAYTNYNYALAYAKSCGGYIVDGQNGEIIYK